MTSLYIHIPFCEKKCYYCSFIVFIGRKDQIEHYVECIEKEMSTVTAVTLKTIYIGGGTPSLLLEAQWRRLLGAIQRGFPYQPGKTEFTVEVNPESIDSKKLRILRTGHVNRISLGVQSLNPSYLQLAGRNHDKKRAVSSYQLIRKHGFSNVNIDFMFGFPGQSLSEIETDLAEIMKWQSEHISVYALNVEPYSRYFARKVPVPVEIEQVKQYLLVKDLLNQHGFRQYEISNFAKPGWASRHNIHYWQGGNYIGIGAGAHSHLDGKRFWNTSRLSHYLSAIGRAESPVEGVERLTPEERLQEALLFGLRMNQGVCINQLENRYQALLNETSKRLISQFISGGFLSFHKGVLSSTQKGQLVLDELSARLI